MNKLKLESNKFNISLISVELPNVQLVDCPEFLGGFDKCMKIKFSYQEEYAALNEVDGSSEVLVGKLYSTDGEENTDSRVSVSIDEGDFYYVRYSLMALVN